MSQRNKAGAGKSSTQGRPAITGIGTQTFTHSAENFLTVASGGVTLYYDPLRRLVEYDTTVSTRLVYDGAEIAAEVDNPAGAIQRRYVRGPGMDELLVEYVGSGTANRRFLTADERGSIIAVTDSAGTVLALNKYDEFGVPQASNLGRFGYTGQAWLGEVGLWYYKARMYRPDIGRFLQTDPIGYAAGPNMYAYVGNDPINAIDPEGFEAVRERIVVTGRVPRPKEPGENTAEDLMTAGRAAFAKGIDDLIKSIYNPAWWIAAERNKKDTRLRAEAAKFLRNAVLAALQQACKCKIDPKIVGALDWNAAQILSLENLPSVFSDALSLHGDASSVPLQGTSYVLKIYLNDPAYGGRNTITITTPTSNLSHWYNVPFWLMGDPVNAMNARSYCRQSRRC